MRVLMFGWEFPPHITGGLGTACFGLTKAMASQNLDIIFVVPKSYGDENQNFVRLLNGNEVSFDLKQSDSREFLEKISYMEINSTLKPYLSPTEVISLKKYLGKKVKIEESVLSENFCFTGKYGPNLMQEVARYALIAAKIGTTQDFDVIHAHDWLTYSAGIAAKESSGKPLVVHVHATEFDRSGENVNQVVYNIEKKGMEAADKVVAVSHLTRNIIIHKYKIPAEKVEVVHNAVEESEGSELLVKKTVPEKIVTFLGRVTFQKGPEYFVEAAHKVLKKDKNVRFVMAGSGDLLHKMIKRAAALKITDKFHFTGFLKGRDVSKMYGLSDVYVMPSVSEPFGISPLEAMKSNVPVIISKQSGVSEILNHAIKVDFWDVDAIADAIYGLLNYQSLSQMFKKLGKDEVDSLKWDRAAVRLKKIYEKLV